MRDPGSCSAVERSCGREPAARAGEWRGGVFGAVVDAQAGRWKNEVMHTTSAMDDVKRKLGPGCPHPSSAVRLVAQSSDDFFRNIRRVYCELCLSEAPITQACVRELEGLQQI